MGEVLGISVAGDCIASVVTAADSDTGVLARNVVTLDPPGPDESPAPAVFAAIVDLVETSPIPVDTVGIAVCDHEVLVGLRSAFADAEERSWTDTVTVVDAPTAYARYAAATSPYRGAVVVAELDDFSAPYPELSVASVDTETGAVLSAARIAADARPPVVDDAGAAVLATTVTAMPSGPGELAGALLIGSGADHAAVESLRIRLGAPVDVPAEPTYAAAHGAALIAEMSVPRSRSSSAGRWLALSAAAAAALVLAVGLVVAIATTRDKDTPVNETGAQVSTSSTPAAPHTHVAETTVVRVPARAPAFPDDRTARDTTRVPTTAQSTPTTVTAPPPTTTTATPTTIETTPSTSETSEPPTSTTTSTSDPATSPSVSTSSG
ncbi:hypothetical protein [Williamsia sterculiae]|uniref:Hsp70 protein n=1 Tax=Williamsia sterculiae TaxID=1344003 RepID=A0A1N7CJW1_9NOCA|nr:hypothetical protein [Williamsia sterculiae]SIR63850.1 hypothetical protein SAMN05445060_0184 [Williamsia sterculiae]